MMKVNGFNIEEMLNKENLDVEIEVELFGRHNFFSILRDLCFYLKESLSCIERGIVTVAYTLARKPLQDNLYYLCWILDNHEEFYKSMKKDSIEYDVSILKKNKENVVAMYDRIIKKIDNNQNLSNVFSGEDLYEIIYDKKSKIGLSSIFDKSIHLVTNNKNYKTENLNLNFIFTDNKNWEEFRRYYYKKFPYLIWFILEVTLKNFEKMLLIPENIVTINFYIRLLKILRVLNLKNKKSIKSINRILFKMFKGPIIFSCNKCGNTIFKEKKKVLEFINDYIFLCSECGEVERVGQYIIFDKLFEKRIICEIEIKDNKYKLKSKYREK